MTTANSYQTMSESTSSVKSVLELADLLYNNQKEKNGLQ
jgi:hypothetical protein